MPHVRASLLALALVGLALPTGAAFPARAETCSDREAECRAVCTPVRVSTYYAGSERRCTASCEPRWQQCLRTGIWVHLEDRYPGWHEPVRRW